MINIHDITGDLEAKMKLYGMPEEVAHIWRYREVVCFNTYRVRPVQCIVIVSFPPQLLTESLKQRIEDLGAYNEEHSIGKGFSVMALTVYYDHSSDRHKGLSVENMTEKFIDEVLRK